MLEGFVYWLVYAPLWQLILASIVVLFTPLIILLLIRLGIHAKKPKVTHIEVEIH